MIGVGNRGGHTMRVAMQVAGVKMVALCDIKPDRLDKAATAAARDNPKTYTDYRKLLDDPAVNAVHVATPCDLHVEHAIAALKAAGLATDGLHMPYQVRDVEQVVAEFRSDDQPYAVFVDNNLGSRPEYLRRLCHALAPLERIWSAAVSIDVTDDPTLVREMALAGCTGVFVGFESLSDANIEAARKKSPRTADYARRVRLFHDHGIQVNASFVLGFDHDRPDVFERTAEWVEENRLECATFHILTPYPGTPLYRQTKAEGRLLHEDWNRYDTAHVVFRPRHMSPEELFEGYAWCYRRLFSHASIWRRRPEDWRAWLPYLGMSYLYKRANWLWPVLIRQRLTHRVWRPLVERTRRRHVRFRRRLARLPVPDARTPGYPLSAGV